MIYRYFCSNLWNSSCKIMKKCFDYYWFLLPIFFVILMFNNILFYVIVFKLNFYLIYNPLMYLIDYRSIFSYAVTVFVLQFFVLLMINVIQSFNVHYWLLVIFYQLLQFSFYIQFKYSVIYIIFIYSFYKEMCQNTSIMF